MATETKVETGESECQTADHVYILMSHKYRISRNVRADWYFSNLGKYISISKRHSVEECKSDLDVVSVIPDDPGAEWDSDTGHMYRYLVTPDTTVTFLSRAYRLVFCLDLSPSVATVDAVCGVSMLEAVMPSVGRCLEGLTRLFYIPGSELLYKPLLYITVIAHTPFFTSQSQQVLVQGWILTQDNLESFLTTVETKLIVIEEKLAEISTLANQQLKAHRMEADRLTGKLFDDGTERTDSTEPVPMVSPDIGFVNMLRYGILALQLLPENSGAGLVVVTDGAVALPDATLFDSLLVQLRNNTVACSFLLLGSGMVDADIDLGMIPYVDLMDFLATATCGALLARLPAIQRDFEYTMNAYHRAFLCWSFQKTLLRCDLTPVRPSPEAVRFCSFIPDPVVPLISKHQADGTLAVRMTSVLSCRLREGYCVRRVSLAENDICINLILPWKHQIFIEYIIRSSWPPEDENTRFDLNIIAPYEFLHDVTCTKTTRVKSAYRRAMFNKFWLTLKSVRHSDQLLVHLHTFNRAAATYTLPESVRRGNPLFYLSENSGILEPFSQEPAVQALCTFWKPVCMLDINIWEKWLHAHRIGLLLEHDHPLPKHLFLPNTSGRHQSVQCRQATKAVTTLLAEISHITLMDGHSYITFLNSGDDERPFSFFMLRVNMLVRPPCMVVRLAFLGGTPVDLRYSIVDSLRRRILALTFTESLVALSSDPPIRKSAMRSTLTDSVASGLELVEKDCDSDEVGGDSVTARATRVSVFANTGSCRPSAQLVHCCILLQKPVEKFLIRYDRVPVNYLEPVIQKRSSASVFGRYGSRQHFQHNSGRMTTQNSTASAMFNVLSRYLHHCRWVWEMQEPNGIPLPLSAIGRIMAALVKLRLREGFCFAHTSSGIISMVLEMEMENPVRCWADHRVPRPCVLQYILFPPYTAPLTSGSRDNLAGSDDDLAESDMASGDNRCDRLAVTECWIEPQTGCFSTSGQSRRQHFDGLTYHQATAKFFEVDRVCVSALLTLEYLLVMCSEKEGASYPSPLDNTPRIVTQPESQEGGIHSVGFCFDLPEMLKHCHQTEILLSTYVQDLCVTDAPSGGESVDSSANTLLFALLLDTLQTLHDHQLQLTRRDCRRLPGMMAARRERRYSGSEHHEHCQPPVFSECDDAVPQWRCFIKCIGTSHALITLLPASYADLQLLAAARRSAAGSCTCGSGVDGVCQTLNGDTQPLLFETERRVANNANNPGFSRSDSGHSARGSSSAAVRPGSAAGPGWRGRAQSVGSSSCSSPAGQQTPGERRHTAVTAARVSATRVRNPSSPCKLQHQQRHGSTASGSSGTTSGASGTAPGSGATTDGESSRASVLGALNLPVYVYDCVLRSLTQTVAEGVAMAADTLRDERFILAECDDTSPAAALGRSNSYTADSDDPHYLSEHCNVSQMVHTRAFVLGIFQSMHRTLPIHPLDVQSAIDVCDEHPLEVNITNFLQMTCGHLRDVSPCIDHFLGKLSPTPRSTATKTETTASSSSRSTSCSSDTDPAVASSCVDQQTAELRLDAVGQRRSSCCSHLRHVHSEVKRRFDRIMATSFGVATAAAAGTSDVYFYLSQAQRTAQNEVSSLPDDADPEYVPSGDEDFVVQFRDMEGVADWRGVSTMEENRSLRTRTSQVSLISNIGSMSGADLDMRVTDMFNDTEQESVPPLFLLLTCSVRTDDDCLTHPVRHLPTCIGELTDGLTGRTIKLDDLRITLDILCLTLPSQLQDRISEHASKHVRTTSFCSDAAGSADFADVVCRSDSTSISDDDNYSVSHLADISEYQQQAISATHSEVQWLLMDEIVSLLLHVTPISRQLLSAVVDHVTNSAGRTQSPFPRRSCIHKQIPLNFVYGADRSMKRFEQLLSELTVFGYRISRLDSLFYLEPVSRTPDKKTKCPCTTSTNECKCDVGKCLCSNKCLEEAAHRRSSFHLLLPTSSGEASGNEAAGTETTTGPARSYHCACVCSAPSCGARQRSYSFPSSSVCVTDVHRATPADGDCNCNIQPSCSACQGQCCVSVGTDRVTGQLKSSSSTFWLIVSVSDTMVDAYFHCRYRQDSLLNNMQILDAVCAGVTHICKHVNQMMLLDDLERTRVCNNLLELETNEDIWSRTNADSATGVCEPHYLEANMQFRPGHFACPVVWATTIPLHVRLRSPSGGASPGMLCLRQALASFAVVNRRNLFVLRDSGSDGNVFYLRLRDVWELGGGGHPSGDSTSSANALIDTSVGRHSACREEVYAEVGRWLTCGNHSVGARLRSESGDYIQLLVHGICQPNESIRCDLVESLVKRLEDRLLELIAMALLRNPYINLTQDDVRFIQPAGQLPHHSLKFKLPDWSVPHMLSIVSNLRRNLLHWLNLPRYLDSSIENQLRNYGGCDSSEIYLYVASEKRGSLGVAVLSVTPIYSSVEAQRESSRESPVDRRLMTSADSLASQPGLHHCQPDDFPTLTHTELLDDSQYQSALACIMFNIWQQCVNVTWLEDQLKLTVRRTLWDVSLQRFIVNHPTGTSAARDLTAELNCPEDPPISKLSRILERRISSPMTQERKRVRRFSISVCRERISPITQVSETSSPILHVSSSANDTTHAHFDGDAVSVTPPPALLSAGVSLNPAYGSTMEQWFQTGSVLSVPRLQHCSVQLNSHHVMATYLCELVKAVCAEYSSGGGRCGLYIPRFDGHVSCSTDDLTSAEDCVNCLIVAHGPRGEASLSTSSGRDDVAGLSHSVTGDGDTFSLGSLTPITITASPLPTPTSRDPQLASPLLWSREPATRFCQCVSWVRVCDRSSLLVYAYNWPRDRWLTFSRHVHGLANWTNARDALLNSIFAQKLGLFHNQPFVRKQPASADKNVRTYINQPAFVGGLISSPAPPASLSGRQVASRSRWLTEALRDCRGFSIDRQRSGSSGFRDAINRHGQQLVQAFAANRRTDQHKRLYQLCQTPELLDKDSNIDSLVKLVRCTGRLLHFCFTPLLFLPSWRRQTAAARDQAVRPPLLARGESVTAAPDSPPGSPPVSRSQPRCGDSGGVGNQRWHQALCDAAVREFGQYLQSLGFLPLPCRHSTAPGSARTSGPQSVLARGGASKCSTADSEVPLAIMHLHRVIVPGGGYALLEIAVEEPFFYVKLYALEGSRPQFHTRSASLNLRTFEAFLRECDAMRAHVHLHSFMYDYHLRTMHQYMTGRPRMLRQGLHVTSFLEDFQHYYTKGPSHGRNFITSGSMVLPSLGATSPDQLYNYLLSHEKLYHLRALRMIPSLEDVGDEKVEDEFALVQFGVLDQSSSSSAAASCTFDLTLVLSRDLGHPLTASRLCLRFYLLLTSRREVYPSVFIERLFDNYRRVETTPTSRRESASPDQRSLETGITNETFYNKAGVNSAVSDIGSQLVSPAMTFHHTANPYNIRPEPVNYMGYFSSHEQYMKSILSEEVAGARTKIRSLILQAVVHCRRDFLWQKLRADKRNKTGGLLSCQELHELLQLLQCRQLQLFDRRIIRLNGRSLAWYRSLVGTLSRRYPRSYRLYQSEDGVSELYFAIILPVGDNSLILLSYKNKHGEVLLVTREDLESDLFKISEEEERSDHDVPRLSPSSCQFLLQLIEDFFNCCLFHIWSSMAISCV